MPIHTNIEGECDECGEMHGNLRHFLNSDTHLCKECLWDAVEA